MQKKSKKKERRKRRRRRKKEETRKKKEGSKRKQESPHLSLKDEDACELEVHTEASQNLDQDRQSGESVPPPLLLLP